MKEELRVKRMVREFIDNRIDNTLRPDQLKWIALNGSHEQSEDAKKRLKSIMKKEIAKEDDTEKQIDDRSFEAMKALHHVYGLDNVTEQKHMESFARNMGV